MFGILIPVNSSAIAAVSYDGSTLCVQFRTSDTVYEHHGIPMSLYLALMNAPSMGAFYNKNIRGKYK